MDYFKKNIVAGLGILAAVGCASIIVSPWGRWITLSPDTSARWVPIPPEETPLTIGVFFYRLNGSLPSSVQMRCGLGMTAQQIKEEDQRAKALDTQVIAEARRQEAQEAPLRRLL